MILTKYGMHVKWVALLDEHRGICTVIGFQKQVATFPISTLKSDDTTVDVLKELRDRHAHYLQMRSEQQAPFLDDLTCRAEGA